VETSASWLGQELTLLDDDFAEREPALARLAAAVVTELLPAGPDVRQRQPIALCGQPGVDSTGPLSSKPPRPLPNIDAAIWRPVLSTIGKHAAKLAQRGMGRPVTAQAATIEFRSENAASRDMV
jgi:hypothetical protein